MGAESFFVNAFLNDLVSYDTIITSLQERGFSVTPYTKTYYKFIFKKNYTRKSVLVLNSIVICDLTLSGEVSFQACFSCYDQAVKTITEAIVYLREYGMISEIFYGTQKLSDLTCERITEFINANNSRRLAIFRTNFTKQYIEVLPDDFFDYYRKHRGQIKN